MILVLSHTRTSCIDAHRTCIVTVRCKTKFALKNWYECQGTSWIVRFSHFHWRFQQLSIILQSPELMILRIDSNFPRYSSRWNINEGGWQSWPQSSCPFHQIQSENEKFRPDRLQERVSQCVPRGVRRGEGSLSNVCVWRMNQERVSFMSLLARREILPVLYNYPERPSSLAFARTYNI